MPINEQSMICLLRRLSQPSLNSSHNLNNCHNLIITHYTSHHSLAKADQRVIFPTRELASNTTIYVIVLSLGIKSQIYQFQIVFPGINPN